VRLRFKSYIHPCANFIASLPGSNLGHACPGSDIKRPTDCAHIACECETACLGFLGSLPGGPLYWSEHRNQFQRQIPLSMQVPSCSCARQAMFSRCACVASRTGVRLTVRGRKPCWPEKATCHYPPQVGRSLPHRSEVYPALQLIDTVNDAAAPSTLSPTVECNQLAVQYCTALIYSPAVQQSYKSNATIIAPERFSLIAGMLP